MKKFFALTALLAVLLAVTNNANAKIRRVGYWGKPIANTDYTTLQSAHDAAVAGDTIYVYPGSWSADYSKKLITIGYGYFVDVAKLGTKANSGLQSITGSLSISIRLKAGSSNSVFEGLDDLDIDGDNSGATLTGIIIRRCNGQIDLGYNNIHSNWQILQCYINQLYLQYSSYNGTISNLIVNNCYIADMYGSGGTASKQTGQFNNNVFYTSSFNNGSFVNKNNILIYSHNEDQNCVYQNNVFNTGYGTVSGNNNVNISSTAMNANVFVGLSNQGTFSNDGRWALKTGSPAIGAGTNGTNCGIYGGNNPYKLSGIPSIPSFYKLTATSNTTSTNPYTITFSVRGNN